MTDSQLSNRTLDLDNDGVTSKFEADYFIENWKHRKNMAWVAIWSIIVVTVVLLVFPFVPIEPDKMSIIADLISWFYFSMASIAGAFIGFSTWADKSK